MRPAFSCSHRVSYAECTLGNHVYYARYLDWFETARGEFFRTLGTPFQRWQEKGVIFPVVECHLRYRAPARYDDVVEIQLWPSMAHGARLNFTYHVLKEGKLLLDAETLHVCTGIDEKPRRLPEELRGRLDEWIVPRENPTSFARSAVLDNPPRSKRNKPSVG